jgi:hypothetical protein
MAKQFTENGLKELNLTKMENQVMEAILDGLYAEPGFSDMGVQDMIQETGISKRSIGGVMGSLTKKGLISIDEVGASCPIIYLSYDFYYLHSEHWANEANERLAEQNKVDEDIDPAGGYGLSSHI